jgi:tetratricopeptide (TPR) repeat protein
MEQSNIGDALFEVAKRESATANLQDAIEAYAASLEVRGQLVARDPVTWAETQRDWCFALWTLGQRTQNEQQKATASVECRKAGKTLDAVFSIKDKLASSYVGRAASAMGVLSYYFVLMRDNQNALDAANSALAASPDHDWINTNKAHALMFLGRTDEARRLYLARATTTDGKQAIAADFNELRGAGLTAPLMTEVEKAISKR